MLAVKNIAYLLCLEFRARIYLCQRTFHLVIPVTRGDGTDDWIMELFLPTVRNGEKRLLKDIDGIFVVVVAECVIFGSGP